jgi:hypothetical protein
MMLRSVVAKRPFTLTSIIETKQSESYFTRAPVHKHQRVLSQLVDSTLSNARSSLFTLTHDLQLNLPVQVCESVTTMFTEANILEGEPQPPHEVINLNPALSTEGVTQRPTTGHSRKVLTCHHSCFILMNKMNRGKMR